MCALNASALEMAQRSGHKNRELADNSRRRRAISGVVIQHRASRHTTTLAGRMPRHASISAALVSFELTMSTWGSCA